MEQAVTAEGEDVVRLSIAQEVEQWIHRLSRAFNVLGVIVLLMMTLLVTCDVFGRYVLLSPIAGSVDIIQVMMAVLVFSGFAYCTSLDGNVRVDVIYVRLSERIRSFLDVGTSSLSVLIIALITWQLGSRAWQIVQEPPGPATGYFQWPLLPFIGWATVASGLLCLELLIWFFHSLNRIRRGKSVSLAVGVEG